MKAIGPIIKQMVLVNLFILMVMFMRDNGLMTKPMETGFTFIKTEQSTRDSGKTIFSTVRENKVG